MATTDTPSLSLDQCVQTLKQQLPSASKAPPKELARLYLAAVGLVCHLKVDQATLYRAQRNSTTDIDAAIPCPPPNEVPAITTVLNDSRLFHSLLACLKLSDAATEPNLDVGTPRYNRKRTYSFQGEGETASKMMKLQHSPLVASVKLTPRSADPQPDAPSLPLPVLAATVLYSAFQYVDHWPAPLVQAYAEDAFGPRIWVDDARCSLLAQNLALVHTNLEQEDKVDDACLAQAACVVQYYEKNKTTPFNEKSHTNGSAMSRRPSSLTPSIGRPRSMSMDSVDVDMTAAPSDSDSGDEEECLIEVSSGRLAKAGNGGSDGSSSSSSGEEDAEVVVMTNSTIEGKPALTPAPTAPPPNPLSSFPATPTSLNLTRVRRRYFGLNLEYAHKAIATSLSDRLDLKSKQNSRLLMALPSFVCIPAVRSLTARYLERWLQSPALSGPARTLFAATVQQMRNVDPPLPQDIETIDSILGMRLKANQLNAHIENVTEISKRIPNLTVSRHIFLRILREQLVIMESGTSLSSPSEPLQMIAAVHGALPANLSCEGLAMALLTLLAEPIGKSEKAIMTRRERHQMVKKIRSLVRSVASVLGAGFDGCGLIESLLSFDVNADSWSLEDEEDKARLLYECATLLIPPPSNEEPRQKSQRRRNSDVMSEEEIAALRKKLKRVRRLILEWCCTEYVPRWQAQNTMLSRHENLVKKSLSKGKQAEEPIGAGPPDYRSVLDRQGKTAKRPRALNTMRCMLFMADAESATMQEFLYPDEPHVTRGPTWYEEEYRIQQCCKYGSDLDNEMLRIILNSASQPKDRIDPSLALALIENLFERCSKDRPGSLQLTDTDLIWELYQLAEYFPSPYGLSDEALMVANGNSPANGAPAEFRPVGPDIPRLAYPAMWWRVTVLALIMCGASPAGIGMEMWKEHPTLCALIKMVTSGRYRFPTVDCDEDERNAMRAAESAIRDEESRIAEQLFLPPPPKHEKAETNDNGGASTHGASRVSVRQREKQEKLKRQQREREAALLLAEANRRKKGLRTVQKSIMLWYPRCPARKPPRESVNLLLSAEDLFSLSEVFHQNVKPDFLLMTIGRTTRGAIELAYDWVIPIISSVPEIISRLPASASCFLLLRAYGAEGEEKSELRKLSAPLLEHVKKSLTGAFGESDAVRAADLLLADMADPKPDRRRCPRRVLQEALACGTDSDSTGLLCLLRVDHAPAMVSDAIEYISRSLAFERGKVLCALVVALNEYITFARAKNVAGSWNFASILCALISSRHNVCSEAMERFPEFRSLAINVVHQEFQQCIHNKRDMTRVDLENIVQLHPCQSARGGDVASKQVSLPLCLLQSVCVLLSIWKDSEGIDVVSKDAIQDLADALMYPYDAEETERVKAKGIESATMMGSGDRAVTVEQWVMLAKSRSDFIARRAALSAPSLFLPRLLLCSGLPTSSLITMIDRLGKLGDKSEDQDRTFKDLLMPSMANEWVAWYPGNRRGIARKLIGRLSAYLHLSKAPPEQNVSLSFLKWLSRECALQMKTKKSDTNKKSGKAEQATNLGSMLSQASSSYVASALGDLDLDLMGNGTPSTESLQIDLKSFDDFNSRPVGDSWNENDDGLDYINKCCTENRPEAIEAWLGAIFTDDDDKNTPQDKISVCTLLLKFLFDGSHVEDEKFASLVLKWVPTLSRSAGTPELWSLMFTLHANSPQAADLVVSRCMALWCRAHIMACQKWILTNYQGLCAQRILRFLVATSGQNTVRIEPFISSTTKPDDFWGISEPGWTTGMKIALEGARVPSSSDANAPTSLPDWLVLLLLLARNGKEAMQRVCEVLLNAMDTGDAKFRERLQSALLRLYACYPMSMKLGNPRLRVVLIEGIKSAPWLDWWCSRDAQLEDLLVSLASSPSQRLVQTMTDLAREHPLLVLRKIPTMIQLLEEDGNVPRFSNARGRTYGENLLGTMEANLSGKSVKVVVRHWGYSFTEYLWMSMLDILMSVPREVIFICGSYMGLRELLGLYAKLLFHQCQLQSNVARLKRKFSDVLTEFESSDAKGWESWLSSKHPALLSLGSTRNILMSASLIPPTKVANGEQSHNLE